MVVLHYTAMASADAALARLRAPAAQVSAHYMVDRDGAVTWLVPESMRAWHAGAGAWVGQDDVNSRAIGIELVNTGAEPFAAPQMHALCGLLRGLLARWAIAPVAVIGHADMAPARKHDPGPRFDWRALAAAGLAVWPDGTATAPAAGLAASLDRIGYPPAPPDDRLRAFRARFRPWGQGPAMEADAARAAHVAAVMAGMRGSG